MAKFICEYCGKEFEAKPSAKRKYCSRECSHAAAKGKPQKSRVEKVLVTCAVCGKQEYVNPSRAKKYTCCSLECLGKYNSEHFSQKVKCVCPVCGKEFYLKPYEYNRSKTHCCSKECIGKYRETAYLRENNPNYGNKGDKNPLFKGYELTKQNFNLEEKYIYVPDYPGANSNGRALSHRYIVWKNKELFNPIFFDTFTNDFKENILVHHIDRNHSNNDINNLCCLTLPNHTSLHGKLAILDTVTLNTLIEKILNNSNKNDLIDIINKYKKEYNEYTINSINKSIKELSIAGVIKREELLENPEVDNQQPSLELTIKEGSETNS